MSFSREICMPIMAEISFTSFHGMNKYLHNVGVAYGRKWGQYKSKQINACLNYDIKLCVMLSVM